MNAPEEPVLDPKFDTCCEIAIPEAHIATEDDSRSNCDVAALSARNNSVGSGMSAGQYLRDFFATQMTLTRKRFANGQ